MTDDAARAHSHKTAPNYLITLYLTVADGLLCAMVQSDRKQSQSTEQRTAFGQCTWTRPQDAPEGCPVSWCHTVKKRGSLCACS